MKLYRVEWQDPFEGVCLSWHASRREAEAYVASESNPLGADSHNIAIVDVPTSKTGLIAWLNQNLNRDNG